ncbi:MAG: rRNA pseudouridine synthase [Saprospiraceae bacterium]|nr:rRNA pseudouridine synthase [Bacteroidia bacterium]NNE14139.1 rRNA pseudouridine synthase [Saprospiraceae bacterium]
MMRLNKYIAHAGVCSRRKAGELVKDGYIKVNGVKNTNPATEINEGDKVEYLGKLLKPIKEKIYLLLNKPRNVITTMDDERGRKTVWDIVKEKVDHKVYPVGRLDRNTTGLLLLTNDGEMNQKLSHPKSIVKKIYHIVLDKALSEEHINQIANGITLEDGFVKVDQISYIQEEGPNHIGVELHSGRNRIIRRIFESLGYEVEKLDRVYFAGLTKKDLPRGWSRKLSEKEIIMLKHFS